MQVIPNPAVDPLISVVCCTHNRSAFVRRHLEILRPHLNEQIELVYALDNCTDDTLKFLTQEAQTLASVRVVEHHGERGLFNCRNFGLTQARGRYIHFLDDDDSVEPGFYAALTQSMSIPSNHDVDIFVTCLRTWLPDGSQTDQQVFAPEWQARAERQGNELHLRGDLFPGVLGGKIYYYNGNALYQSALLRRYGFRSGFKKSADWLLNLESALSAPLHVALVESAVANYFIHENSMSLGPDKAFWNARVFEVLLTLTEGRPEYREAVRTICAEANFSAAYAMRRSKPAEARKHYLRAYSLGKRAPSVLALAKMLVRR